MRFGETTDQWPGLDITTALEQKLGWYVCVCFLKLKKAPARVKRQPHKMVKHTQTIRRQE